MNAELTHLSEQPGKLLFKNKDPKKWAKLQPGMKCDRISSRIGCRRQDLRSGVHRFGKRVFWEISFRKLGNKFHSRRSDRSDRKKFLT
jgi:hypothetical protein